MAGIEVPARVRLRPYLGESDLPAIVRIMNAEAEADRLPERTSLDALGVLYTMPNRTFEPLRDVTVAEIDGTPVGVAERTWVETTDGHVEYRMDGAVDPAWRRRGIGTALHADSEARVRELAATRATDRPRLFGSWSGDSQPGDRALLERAGFQPARWFFDMERPHLEDVPDAPLPDGLVVRPIDRELARPVWKALVEAFLDHWGGMDGSDERLERWLAAPSTDLALWIVAFDGDEVAGGVVNTIDREENALLGVNSGWLSSVFTRRPWRRRGLARALITRSLVALRGRGMTSAALGVDGENPTGALGLYEGLGFEVTHRSIAWRREFRS